MTPSGQLLDCFGAADVEMTMARTLRANLGYSQCEETTTTDVVC